MKVNIDMFTYNVSKDMYTLILTFVQLEYQMLFDSYTNYMVFLIAFKL